MSASEKKSRVWRVDVEAVGPRQQVTWRKRVRVSDTLPLSGSEVTHFTQTGVLDLKPGKTCPSYFARPLKAGYFAVARASCDAFVSHSSLGESRAEAGNSFVSHVS